MRNDNPLNLELEDDQWPFSYTDHDREIVRAIVFDGDGAFYFVRANRDDEFVKATLIETSGGGVEPGEELTTALRRELREELGAEVEVLCPLGVVSDYYNLIHRHNINHYYLCRVLSFGETQLTAQETEDFHLSTLRLSYEEALAEYEKRAESPLGTLIAHREVPVLRAAKALIDEQFRLELVEPGMDYDAQIRAYRRAFLEQGAPAEGSGSVLRYERTEDWLAELARNLDPKTLPPGRPLTRQYLFVRETDGKVVGMLQIRHPISAALARSFGHIGYSVCPGERRKGYATEMLRQGLEKCRALGLDRVTVSCAPDNEASRRTILRNGGIYEATVYVPEKDCRLETYRITL